MRVGREANAFRWMRARGQRADVPATDRADHLTSHRIRRLQHTSRIGGPRSRAATSDDGESDQRFSQSVADRDAQRRIRFIGYVVTRSAPACVEWIVAVHASLPWRAHTKW